MMTRLGMGVSGLRSLYCAEHLLRRALYCAEHFTCYMYMYMHMYCAEHFILRRAHEHFTAQSTLLCLKYAGEKGSFLPTPLACRKYAHLRASRRA